ncbi:superoxide dismutase family protein [Escherichia coli]|uniref:superoxide dismutase family protein n=1 Tax=Escherichia coli TaxID=562 RepID=UPI0019193740|nr:superoxide dismutase family protein [Escherichia coli]CAD5568909.1 copper/zinc-superoxide dismutase [Escherichia coli]
MKKKILTLAFLFTSAATADVIVPVNLVSEQGIDKSIGEITITETRYGLLFTPQLTDLLPGVHGFHIHENASCEPGLINDKKVAALSAGGHYDPDNTGKHLGPYDPDGHLGDLPALYVNTDGKAEYPVLSTRITKLSQIKERSIMIHTGGDNHSDFPTTLGGGGSRVACGIIN